MNERTILHVDANNFYASVECMLHPELRGYPIAVCGDVEERHGIVLAKNYAAKAYGVSTGEAIWQAKQKCKDLIIVPPHYDDYMKISKAARDIYCDYTDKVPLPLVLAHNICREIDIQKRKYRLRGVMPDGKAQVTVEYEDGKAKRIKTIVVSVQHSKKKPFEELENEIRNEVLPIALSVFPADEDTEILINPAGCFNIGGPEGDTGLTGRKIMVDTYGGLVAHGGGAFSGKDATKVDRSGAYMARYIAKNIVKAGLAERCQVGIWYAIGKAEPIAVSVDSFGTSSITDEELAEIVTKVFDLRPAAIIDRLDLSMPIYKKTSAYGHFNSPDFPWEKTDAVPELMKVAI